MTKDTSVKGGVDDIKELQLDLITFEVLRNAFVSACYEGSTRIEKMAYHPVVGMGRDRSNGILTIDGGLVAHGHTDAAAHYGSFEDSLVNLLKHIPAETMEPGDGYMFSDPYEVGSHVNDTHLYKPIFSNDELVMSLWPSGARLSTGPIWEAPCRVHSTPGPHPVTQKACGFPQSSST
jgi:N-methylhydantoinase B/oxoprolinase/acetone carboxylase alpha subunit